MNSSYSRINKNMVITKQSAYLLITLIVINKLTTTIRTLFTQLLRLIADTKLHLSLFFILFFLMYTYEIKMYLFVSLFLIIIIYIQYNYTSDDVLEGSFNTIYLKNR